jgi:transposase
MQASKQVFLILDNLGVHHCKPVKAWLAGRMAQIEVPYLPSYSPELNPDERLDANLKHVIGTKVPVRTMGKLYTAANEHIQLIESDPGRVSYYFQDPRVRDAA